MRRFAPNGGGRLFFVVGFWGRSCLHCLRRRLARGVAQRAANDFPPNGGRPRTARAGAVGRSMRTAAPPLPLRYLSASAAHGREGAGEGLGTSHAKSFFKKKPSGCLGAQFSACIRFTSAQKAWYVLLPTFAFSERSQMKLSVASVHPYLWSS